jgi:hypothetical protein
MFETSSVCKLSDFNLSYCFSEDCSAMTASSKISLFEHFGREPGQIYRPTVLYRYRPGQVLRVVAG